MKYFAQFYRTNNLADSEFEFKAVRVQSQNNVVSLVGLSFLVWALPILNFYVIRPFRSQ